MRFIRYGSTPYSATARRLTLADKPQLLVLKGGFYDILRRPELEDELSAVKPAVNIVLDLSLTTHLDAGSLGLIIRKLREWRTEVPAAQVRLRHVTPRLNKVLTILKLDQQFIIEPD